MMKEKGINPIIITKNSNPANLIQSDKERFNFYNSLNENSKNLLRKILEQDEKLKAKHFHEWTFLTGQFRQSPKRNASAKRVKRQSPISAKRSPFKGGYYNAKTRRK